MTRQSIIFARMDHRVTALCAGPVMTVEVIVIAGKGNDFFKELNLG
ncbi:MAG: hypothetical protein HY659_11475 [Rhizobiales bacterium]|nr:hypothetical protein [Hyphomicrobiales bacterium]